MLMRLMTSICVLGLSLIAGCSSAKEYDGDQRAAISGKVSYDGQPVKAGSIIFEANGEGGRTVSSTILEGEYMIKEAAGPTFGKYKVKIESFEFIGEGDNATKKQLLPEQFNKETTLELKVDKPLMEETNFDLTPPSN